ncbi:MAG TPA: tetratricopeptide repeat protein [Armatimonadota bacterium]|jgi:TolA-binding protein
MNHPTPARKLSPSAAGRLAALLLLVVVLPGCTTRAQRLYFRATSALAQGRYQQAAADYTTLLQTAPRDPLAPEALYKLGFLYQENFNDPSTAIRLYGRLVSDYPDSPFVANALMWTLYVQARQLQDPQAVYQTCLQVDQLLADQPRLRASARLELARSYATAGQIPAAAAVLQQIIDAFGSDAPSASEATYRLALLTRDQLGKPAEALKLLESVIRMYPDTVAASRARTALGWQYYTLKNLEDQQRQQQLQRLAKVLAGVPAPSAQSHPSLELLAGLQSLLAQAGTPAHMDDLLLVTGLAFQTVVNWGSPNATLYFHRNPLPQVAEAWGWGYNSWSFTNAGEALLPFANSLALNRPVLLLYGGKSPRWCLFTGYQPASQQVYLLRPGQSRASVLTAAEFAQGWPQGTGPRLFAPLPRTGYQFSLTEQSAVANHAELVKSAVLRATLDLDQTDLQGAPSGRAGYDELVRKLDAAAAGDVTAATQLTKWAPQALPLIARARQSAAASLQASAADFTGPQQAAVTEAARRFALTATRWQGLADQIAAAATSGNWSAASAEAQNLGVEEQQVLRYLAASFNTGG